MASHIVFDESTGMSAMMKTFERDPAQKPGRHTLRAPMMALVAPDPALMFPDGTTLIPQLFLRNTSQAPLNATLTLNWRTPKQRGSLPLPALSLGRGEVGVLDLAGLAAKAQLPADAYWGTVDVEYQGRSGDLAPVATSFDATGRYGLQTPFSEDVSHLWKGSMWHADARRNSLITAGNGGNVATHAALTLFYNNGKSSYTIEKLLEPEEQLWADVGEIIRNQIPDKDGKTIPPDVTMGSYELRDLDHRGVGYLYEGKLVLDKTWGHGYYGCARCCGFEIARLNPNPFSGVINTGGDDFAEAADCDANWYDFTGAATNWASSNTAVARVAKAYTNLVGVGSAFGSSDLILESTAYRCPQKTFTPGNTINSVKVQITSADIVQNKVTVVLSGPSGISGTLTVNANGPSSVTIASATAAAGTYTYGFPRRALPAGEYTSVSASWTAANGATASGAVSFDVLGLTRFSTYNTPYQAQCGGGTGQAFIFVNNPSTCTYSSRQLSTTFMSQVGINGTGVSSSNGILKVFNATSVGQSCQLPPGGIGSGASANTFVGVSSITGSCNVAVSSGNLATNPNPNPPNGSWNCSDRVLLVNDSNQNNAINNVVDYCPACSAGFNGTNGHIDLYNSTQVCNPHSFTDYGNYYAIRLR